MDEVAYKEDISPYSLNKEMVDALNKGMVDALSNLGFTGYGGNEGEPADVIPLRRYPEGLISSLRRRYEFRDGEAVREFLLVPCQA